ncbi:MAG TPA: SRPBCC domain-containing protein [Albidovulum sp.]|uniref:SRPBCC domain-containing protein n=1 Tax=Albidovulum sp. TaxID=1872424 RepID=UPI002C84D29D|nr:SRPBCC domain-containing protein [Albidovulum sp.]
MGHDRKLILDRLLQASPENVWRCWTEPELAKQWFAPKPVETTVFEMDVRPGGGFRTVMVIPDHGEMAGDPGCVLLAERAKRLVWTNCLGPDFVPNKLGNGPIDFGFTVDIRLTPEAGGCRYVATVTHADDAGMKKHEAMGFQDGWGAATAQLEALAGGM